jgi:hypothetical protein
MYLYCMTVGLCMTTLTEVFSCFFLSCKANARVMSAKTGARPALFLIFCVVLCIFCVVLYIFLCCSMYFFVLFYVMFVL